MEQALLLLALLCFCLLGARSVQAQFYSASLTGVVRDTSGAVMPNAKVTVTDVRNGFSYRQATNAAGLYTFPSVPPSAYKLIVSASGFSTYQQNGVTLVADQHATLNVTLHVGSPTQTISVTGAAPLLSTQDSTTGQNIDRLQINQLPLVGRSVYNLTFLAPGINPAAGQPYGTPQLGNDFTSNGGRNSQYDITIDGVTTTSYGQNSGELHPLYAPSVDAVQEYTVEQNNFSADKGFSGNTIVNVVTRSGTNSFHGSVYEFFRNSALDANNWFDNADNIPISPLHWNDYGATVGGPIKKDKVFFFVDWEGQRESTMSTFAAGVPSVAERNGDFGELCGYNGGTFNSAGVCSSAAGQLWDPYSGVYNPNYSGPVRSQIIPFNNMATYQSPGSPVLAGTPYQPAARPGNLIDPVAMKMMQYFPTPNVGVGTPSYNYFDNWGGSGSNPSANDQGDVKIDTQFSPRTTLSSRFSMDYGNFSSALCWDNPLDPCSTGPNYNKAENVSLNLTHSLNPNTVLTASFGFIRDNNGGPGVQAYFPNFNPFTSLGIPSYLNAMSVNGVPAISIYSGYQLAQGSSIGAQPYGILRYVLMNYDPSVSVDHMQGRHEFKFGGEYRKDFINFFQPGFPEGSMNFDFSTTSEYPATGGGDAMASFMTGFAGPGQFGSWYYNIRPPQSTASSQWAGYFQDNWRATSKLTLNLGVRYDVYIPRTERYNRQGWLNLTARSPLQVPGLPPLVGGLEFANSGLRTTFNTNYNNWAPRFGFAYHIFSNTVIRGGYGIFYNPPNYTASGTGPGGFDGFDETSTAINTYQNDGATPWAPLSNPYPNGLTLPPGSSQGLLTNVGFSVSDPIRTWNQTPYMQTWSLGFQHQLPGNVLVEANYIGTKGTRLYYLGAGSLQYLGSWVQTASPAEIAKLNTYVPNPFFGYITNPLSGLSSAYVPQSSLMVKYPQFTGFSGLAPPWANSSYNAFQLTIRKNFSHGLQLLTTYTISKSIDDASVGNYATYLGGSEQNIRDPNNFDLERSLSQYDVPQALQFSYVYQLPFGRGKHFGANWNKLTNTLLGGWETTAIWTFDEGIPIALGLSGGTSLPTYGPQAPDLLAPLKKNNCSESCMVNQYFANPQVAVVPPPYTLGTAPRDLSSPRAPGVNTEALGLFKELPLSGLREGAHLELRLETFNAFNYVQFAAPNATVNTGSFGQITSQLNSPRQVQLGIKFYW